MLTNRERFLYAVGTEIQGLCEQNNPPPPPNSNEDIARTWFMATGGTQPNAVTTWFQGVLSSGLFCVGVQYTFHSSWGNAFAYMAELDAMITNLVQEVYDPSWSKQKVAAWIWFRDEPYEAGTRGDVPMEVIGWLQQNPPRVAEARPGTTLEAKVAAAVAKA